MFVCVITYILYPKEMKQSPIIICICSEFWKWFMLLGWLIQFNREHRPCQIAWIVPLVDREPIKEQRLCHSKVWHMGPYGRPLLMTSQPQPTVDRRGGSVDRSSYSDTWKVNDRPQSRTGWLTPNGRPPDPKEGRPSIPRKYNKVRNDYVLSW